MSKYALNLDADGRILSATYETYAAADMPLVESLPDGDITDYKYINNEYVYDPLPKPDPELQEPTTDELLDILLGTGGKSNE